MNNSERPISGKDASTGEYLVDKAAELYAQQQEKQKQKEEKEMEEELEEYKRGKQEEKAPEHIGIVDPEEETTG